MESNEVEKSYALPSTLTSPPTKATVPPGECQFGDEFAAVKLVENIPVSPTSFVLRFALPDESKSLGLSTCACLLAGADIESDGETEYVIRPYTPISTNADIGYFDLLVKKYDNGKMSSYLKNLTPSTESKPVSFKHIPFNVKIQYPFDNTKVVGMIAGGTGITPIIQALHSTLGDSEVIVKESVLLYGSRTSDDILGKVMLDRWEESQNEKFKVTHVLSHEPEDSGFQGFERGFINKELIKKSFPGPDAGSDVLIFVCGPPPMYNALCGPRTDKEVTGILGEMGYSSSQVVKF